MPTKGIVKCQDCDVEFEVALPDDKRQGYWYMSTKSELDEKLVMMLQSHHLETARYRGMLGHKNFDVFLEDGRQGRVEANSYCVIYKVLGKERY